MRRRIQVEDSGEAISLPRSVMLDLQGHARETAPEECCGLVVGTDGERYRRVVRCRNEMTLMNERSPEQWPMNNRSGFYMNHADYLPWAAGTTADGERVTAVYHSHVGVDSYLSSVDLELVDRSLFPNAEQVVISVREGQFVTRIFRRDGIGCPFVGHPVVVATP